MAGDVVGVLRNLTVKLIASQADLSDGQTFILPHTLSRDISVPYEMKNDLFQPRIGTLLKRHLWILLR